MGLLAGTYQVGMERNPRNLDVFYIRTTNQAQPIVLESSASHLVYRRHPLPRLPTKSQSTPLEDRRRVPLLWVQRFAAGDPLARVKKNLVSHTICAVTAMVGYRQAAETVQWSLAEGQGYCSQAF